MFIQAKKRSISPLNYTQITHQCRMTRSQHPARVAESVYAADLKSAVHWAYGFKSRPGHHSQFSENSCCWSANVLKVRCDPPIAWRSNARPRLHAAKRPAIASPTVRAASVRQAWMVREYPLYTRHQEPKWQHPTTAAVILFFDAAYSLTSHPLAREPSSLLVPGQSPIRFSASG